MNQLEQLKKITKVVSDTGDFESIKLFKPQDATTNPTLILQAAKKAEYRHLIEKSLHDAKKTGTVVEKQNSLIDHLFINFGLELLQIVPGRVSTEVSADLSFNTEASIERARHLVTLYERERIPRERVLIKLASTWEGIRAAEVLEMEGIQCNMTLLFSLPQAIMCAEANVTLVSPFVGRIYDWYQKQNPTITYTGETDPGVLSVREIYDYYKKFDYQTEIMGASFRNKEQITALAGCDLLTISPKLLDELKNSNEPLEQKLSPEKSKASPILRKELNEATFRFMLNENQMAAEKLSEGIRIFAKDIRSILEMVKTDFPNW